MSVSKGVALITGSAQGLGRAISLRLANDGYDLALNDLPTNRKNLGALVEEIKAKGRKAFSVTADVTREDQVESMMESAVKNLGSLDVMVANAGVAKFATPIVETTTKDWERAFEVNVKGVFLCYKYAGLQMVAQGRGGRIIGASSAAGKRGYPLLGSYSATKFAVRGLTQALAQELGPHRITVNAYAPGVIDTPMVRKMDAELSEKTGAPAGEFFKHATAMSTLGYMGTTEDVASVVSYLASKEAHFITGQSVSVNGGWYCD